MSDKIIPLQSMRYSGLDRELERIEKSLSKPVSPRKCERVFHILTEHIHSLENIKNSADYSHLPTHLKTIEQLEQKIISLFGRALGRKVDFQVGEIKQNTGKLENSINSGSAEMVKKQSTTLDKKVKTLVHDHCVGKDHLQVISHAKKTIALAKNFLHNGGVETIHHISFLSKEKAHVAQQMQPNVSTEEIEELFSLAAHLFLKNAKEAKKVFNELSQEIKHLIERKSASLGSPLLSDELISSQAIISIAYELSGCGEHIFTDKELRALFTEAASFEAFCRSAQHRFL